MSIALDLALILRDSENKLNLSLSNIGAAYTLAFRVGSNPFTWISQENLAKEMGISESNVRVHCNKLAQCGILLIKKYKNDKRKNTYSFDPILINYHQKNDEEKKNCRLLLGGKNKDTAYKQAVNAAYKQAVISDLHTTGDPATSTLNECVQIPKAKEQSNNKSKATSYVQPRCTNAQKRFDEFWSVYPRKKNKKKAKEIWDKIKCDEIAEMIINDVKNRILNDQDWQNDQYLLLPSTYLQNNRWEDDLTLKKFNSSEKFNPLEQGIKNILKSRSH